MSLMLNHVPKIDDACSQWAKTHQPPEPSLAPTICPGVTLGCSRVTLQCPLLFNTRSKIHKKHSLPFKNCPNITLPILSLFSVN